MTFRVMFYAADNAEFDDFAKSPARVHFYFRTRLFKYGNKDTSSVVVRVWPTTGDSYSLNYNDFCKEFPE